MPKKLNYVDEMHQKYRPHQMVMVQGILQELISYPYPKDPEKGDNEAWVCVRDKDDPTTLTHVKMELVELITNSP